jgi:hypothetical protein
MFLGGGDDAQQFKKALPQSRLLKTRGLSSL